MNCDSVILSCHKNCMHVYRDISYVSEVIWPVIMIVTDIPWIIVRIVTGVATIHTMTRLSMWMMSTRPGPHQVSITHVPTHVTISTRAIESCNKN